MEIVIHMDPLRVWVCLELVPDDRWPCCGVHDNEIRITVLYPFPAGIECITQTLVSFARSRREERVWVGRHIEAELDDVMVHGFTLTALSHACRTGGPMPRCNCQFRSLIGIHISPQGTPASPWPPSSRRVLRPQSLQWSAR